MIRLIGRPKAVSIPCAALCVIAVALIGSNSAMAATTAPAVSPGYLFSIPTAAGSLTGRSDAHLTLRMSGARDYLTRFTDRPLRQAFVVANVNFAKRFKGYFARSRPNAVLTYTPHGSQIPVSIVLTIGPVLLWLNAERLNEQLVDVGVSRVVASSIGVLWGVKALLWLGFLAVVLVMVRRAQEGRALERLPLVVAGAAGWHVPGPPCCKGWFTAAIAGGR